MRVLVTGADGFIGSRLVNELKKCGHQVFCHSISDGDISSPDALDGFSGIEHVFHLAARTFVPSSWKDTYGFFQTNMMGAVTALEFCRKCGSSITMMSTYVYGEPEYLPIDEKHPVIGMSPYHESKIACERLCAFYSRSFSMKATVLRPFNVYGKGQSLAFLLPYIYSQAMDKTRDTVEVKDLEPRRDFIYVDDVVKAIVLTLKAPDGYHVYNVGSGVSVSVEDAIQAVYKAVGTQKPYRSLSEKRQAEISDCVADIGLMREELGFAPEFTLESGLKAWYLEDTKEMI